MVNGGLTNVEVGFEYDNGKEDLIEEETPIPYTSDGWTMEIIAHSQTMTESRLNTPRGGSAWEDAVRQLVKDLQLAVIDDPRYNEASEPFDSLHFKLRNVTTGTTIHVLVEYEGIAMEQSPANTVTQDLDVIDQEIRGAVQRFNDEFSKSSATVKLNGWRGKY